MAEYAGETIAKKVSRVRLYRRVKQMLKAVDRDKDVRVLFLPGPEFLELGCLKYILGAKAENCVAVDEDAQACENAALKWNGLKVVNKPLQDAFTKIVEVMEFKGAAGEIESSFEFIHLDLMGNFSQERKFIYGLYSLMCANGSIAAMTFLRGREKGVWKEILESTKSMAENAFGFGDSLNRYLRKVISADPKRCLAHIIGLENESLLVDAHFKGITNQVFHTHGEMKTDIGRMLMMNELWWAPIVGHSYLGDSPMGVVAAQLRPGVLNSIGPRNYWWKEANNLNRHAVSVISKDPMLELLQEIESVEKSFSKDETAEIFGTTKQTIAAWKAHKTMGTYER